MESVISLPVRLARGKVSGDLVQRVPAAGPPPALVSGKTYYIYTMLDIGLPVVRCLFQAP